MHVAEGWHSKHAYMPLIHHSSGHGKIYSQNARNARHHEKTGNNASNRNHASRIEVSHGQSRVPASLCSPRRDAQAHQQRVRNLRAQCFDVGAHPKTRSRTCKAQSVTPLKGDKKQVDNTVRLIPA